MSLSNEDLEDYVEKFRNMFYTQNDGKINQTDMWTLIDSLSDELELSRKREECLENNLAKLLEGENADITTKFVSVTEKSETFEKENAALRNQLNDLQMQMTANVELQQNEHQRELTELKQKYESEILKLKEQAERDRTDYQAKEKKLYEELQLAQASVDLQCDEIESNLKRQLVDANSKLRNLQNVIRSLQMELNNLRNQSVIQQTHSLYKPSKPEIRFQPLPVSTTRPSIHLNYDDFELEDQESIETPPLKTHDAFNRSVTPIDNNFIPQNSAPIVFRGSKTIPKKPEASPVKVKTAKKKRKLYDPNDFDPSNLLM